MLRTLDPDPAVTAPGRRSEFVATLIDMRSSVLCFVLVRRVGHALSRVFKVRLASGFAIACIAGFCPVAALALGAAARGWNAPLWVGNYAYLPRIPMNLGWNLTSWLDLYYCSLNAALLAFPADAWARLETTVSDMEDVIKRKRDRQHLIAVVTGARRLDVQILLGLAGFVAGVIGAGFAARALSVSVLAAMPFELSIGITMLLGSNVVLWIANGLYWVREMSRLPSVRFDPIDPMLTPGLTGMYSLAIRAQAYATLGVILALAPLVYLYSLVRSSQFLQAMVVVGGAGAVVVLVLACTLAPWYLHVMRRNDKHTLLLRLRASLPCDPARLAGDHALRRAPQLAFYDRMAARPTGGLDGALVAGLLVALATLAAALLPFVVLGR